MIGLNIIGIFLLLQVLDKLLVLVPSNLSKYIRPRYLYHVSLSLLVPALVFLQKNINDVPWRRYQTTLLIGRISKLGRIGRVISDNAFIFSIPIHIFTDSLRFSLDSEFLELIRLPIDQIVNYTSLPTDIIRIVK